ncbi:GntR family transcriptional regulator [Salinibacterium sp. ZJ70]|uniref:GntR family transcriptional regulator n=1 Tax=Salinibacterium sp. ZJ70 TaxID=2708084 RepID=UPI001CD2C639|nr:GntR family transcriptional regulator [Salinibacterium sp. ZJ70]
MTDSASVTAPDVAGIGSLQPGQVAALRTLRGVPQRGDTVGQVTGAIREAVLQGVLPAGSWLREDDLAAALQVSRTPIREALRTLGEEGLLERTANRGSVVARMTFDELASVYAMRETLEGLAARLAAGRTSPALVERLTGIHEAMADAVESDPSALAHLNLDFHRAIAEAAENPYLTRFLGQIENALRRLTQTTYAHGDRATAAHDEHRAIIDAIAAGDGARAEDVARSHMRNARDVRIAQLLGG